MLRHLTMADFVRLLLACAALVTAIAAHGLVKGL
jgi:hypothetical protein